MPNKFEKGEILNEMLIYEILTESYNLRENTNNGRFSKETLLKVYEEKKILLANKSEKPTATFQTVCSFFSNFPLIQSFF